MPRNGGRRHQRQKRLQTTPVAQFADDPGDSPASRKRFIALTKLILSYRSDANGAYSGNAEAKSMMMLTIMELWVECDKYASQYYPLLLNYTTGFPPRIFDSLILPKREQLLRLACVEAYLESRRFRASGGPPWNLSEKSFALAYYNRCPTLKRFHDQIKSQANRERRAKEIELMKNRDKYYKLITTYDESKHWKKWPIATSYWRSSTSQCIDGCPTCKADSDIKSLGLKPFEEPLPADQLAAKTIVFEILIPEIVHYWRDTTLAILCEILGWGDSKASQHSLLGSHFYHPESHPTIEVVLKDHSFERSLLCEDARFKLASEDVYVNDTIEIRHANTANMFKKHGHSYDFYDDTSGKEVSALWKISKLSSDYSYPPPTLSEPLRSWIVESSHSSNHPMASLPDCPSNMSFDEFKAFGSLRAGHQLQWHNILSQLVIPTINFNKPETLFLVLHAANQAGPKTDSGPLRDTHFVLEDEKFGLDLLGGLQDALRRVQDNWESDVSWCILLSLATRILFLTGSTVVQEGYLAYLEDIRRRSIQWCRILRERLGKSSETHERQELSRRALIMALICHGTFDIGASHLESVFSHHSEPSLLVESSMIVAEHIASYGDLVDVTENMDNDKKDEKDETDEKEKQKQKEKEKLEKEHAQNLNQVLTILIYRWRRVSYETEPLLRKAIVNKPVDTCLDAVIRKSLRGYERSSTSWSCRPGQHRHVLVAHARTTESHRQRHLQYNVLTGSFLVDGQPPSVLPPNYLAHPTYKRLFGDQIIQVVPSDLLRMRFQGANNEIGHEVHLGMIGDELIVRTRDPEDGNKKVYELIPTSKLEDHFPNLLISEYTHWYVLGENTIEFRPLDNIWSPFKDRQGLILHVDKRGSGYLAKNDSELMVGLESETTKVLSEIFQPLERRGFLHLAYDRRSSRLEIDLPRLRTSFSLRRQEKVIKSKNYRGFVIDEDQSLGALHGLKSKLILRSQDNLGGLVSRAVIIPEGGFHVTRERQGYASAWLVSSDSQRYIRPHFFHIDEGLGVLLGHGTLRSELLLCHLHALTSHFLPDPLTGCTGTGKALRILNSAAVQSFARSLGPEHNDDIKLLRQISRVSPRRFLARTAPGRMQTAEWSDISALAQSDAFYEAVQRLLKQARDFEDVFTQGRKDLEPLGHSNEELHRRHRTRLAPYEMPEFESEKLPKNPENVYTGRGSTQAERRIYRLARLLMNPQPGCLTEPILPSPTCIKRISTALGCRIPECPLQLEDGSESPAEIDESESSVRLPMGFDVRWLDPPSVTMRRSWLDVHAWLCQSDVLDEDSDDRYELIMFFAALSFAKDADDQVIQLLLSFAISPATRPMVLPTSGPLPATQPQLTLTDGAVLDEPRLIGLAKMYAPDSDSNKEVPDWFRFPGSWSEYKSMKNEYERTRSQNVDRLVKDIKSQWPCEDPRVRGAESYPKYFALNNFIGKVQPLFRSWLRNEKHMDYLRSVIIKMAESFQVMERTHDQETSRREILWELTPSACQILSLHYLFEHLPAPEIQAPEPRIFWEHFLPAPAGSHDQIEPEMHQLLDALSSLHNPKLKHQQQYIADLQNSFESFRTKTDRSPSAGFHPGTLVSRESLKANLMAHLQDCRQAIEDMKAKIVAALRQGPRDSLCQRDR